MTTKQHVAALGKHRGARNRRRSIFLAGMARRHCSSIPQDSSCPRALSKGWRRHRRPDSSYLQGKPRPPPRQCPPDNRSRPLCCTGPCRQTPRRSRSPPDTALHPGTQSQPGNSGLQASGRLPASGHSRQAVARAPTDVVLAMWSSCTESCHCCHRGSSGQPDTRCHPAMSSVSRNSCLEVHCTAQQRRHHLHRSCPPGKARQRRLKCLQGNKSRLALHT